MNHPHWLPSLLVVFTLGCGSAPPPPPASPDELTPAVDGAVAGDEGAPEADAPCDSAEDCNNQGAMALLAGRFAEGLPMLRKGCRLESAAACSNLGGAFLRGDGGEPDLVSARTFLERACELGSDGGCTDAGVIYHRGDGVPRDERRALELFELGCARGDDQGCFNGGLLLVDGDGIPHDEGRALEMFTKACGAGHVNACSNAGIMLYQGKGGPTDFEGAVPFFEKACDHDVSDGCFNLGVAYLKGKGVAEDRARSSELFKKACDLGDSDACGIVAELDSEGSAEAAAPSTSLGASSMTVDGLTVSDLSCDLQGGGFFGTMTIIAGLAERKQALDKCAPRGDTPQVTWTMKSGKTTAVEVAGAASDKIARCVKKAMKKMRAAIDGRCSGVIHLGE